MQGDPPRPECRGSSGRCDYTAEAVWVFRREDHPLVFRVVRVYLDNDTSLAAVDGNEVPPPARAIGSQGEHSWNARPWGTDAFDLAKRLVDNPDCPDRRNGKAEIAVERSDFLGKAKVNGNLLALDSNLRHGSSPCLQHKNVSGAAHKAIL